MKLKISILLITYLFSEFAFSQNKIPGFIGFAGVGLSIPTAGKVFSKSYRAGWNINGAGGYLFNNTYAARLDLQYNNFTYKETDPTYSGKFISYSVTGNLLAGDFGKYSYMNPYGLIGLGVFVNSDRITSKDGYSSNSAVNMGIGLGAGLNLKATEKIGMFTEMQYIFIFHEGIAKGYLPFKMGITFRK